MAEGGEWRLKDGVAWRIGSDDDIAWINEHKPGGTAITSAIPAVFDDYATITHPGERGVPRNYADEGAQDRALLALLTATTPSQPWWLGYLDTGASDIIFLGRAEGHAVRGLALRPDLSRARASQLLASERRLEQLEEH